VHNFSLNNIVTVVALSIEQGAFSSINRVTTIVDNKLCLHLAVAKEGNRFCEIPPQQ
jgi:hypothetical protein